MSQAYIHACERAELLGLPIPSEEEWKETQRIETDNNVIDNDDEMIQTLDSSNETAQRIGGGLDELNTILNATQKKINRFKNVCGSLSTLLKVKVGSRNSTPDHKHPEQNDSDTQDVHAETSTYKEDLVEELSSNQKDVNKTESDTIPKKIDINEKMGSHLDKLDSLIVKAENAQHSMQHQTKQMKKFLK